jgi:uncharacterized protein
MNDHWTSSSDPEAVFQEGLINGEFRVQKCDSCAVVRHPPVRYCAACGQPDWSAVSVSPVGTVISWVIPRRPNLPAPPAATNQVVVLVELEQGIRLLGHMASGSSATAIGDQVQGSVGHHGDVLIPVFRRIP